MEENVALALFYLMKGSVDGPTTFTHTTYRLTVTRTRQNRHTFGI